MMINRFLSNNMSSMTFVFSMIVLLNSTLAYFQVIDLGDVNRFILGVAILVLVLSFIAYTLSYFSFPSEKVFHMVNFGSQFIVFLSIGSLLGIIPLSVEGVIINLLLAWGLYSLVIRIRKHELNKLALAINERLSN